MRPSVFTFFALAASLVVASCNAFHASDAEAVQYVNPFIGTGGHGHTHPGAMVPHGMIQPGPDTRIHDWDACSGYHYSDDSINGFAHTRLSGTGCADFGDFLVMPTVGEQDVRYVGEKDAAQRVAFVSPYSHDEEMARPGYYAVSLQRYGIRAELTATCRTALHRWTFPESDSAGLILDLDYCIQDQTTLDMQVEVRGDTIRAYRRDNWWQYDHRQYFEAITSRPIVGYDIVRDTVTLTRDAGRQQPRCKLLVQFGATKAGEQILLKAAVSSVDAEGAHRNLLAEMPAWDFDATAKAAEDSWREALGCIEVEIDENDACQRAQREIFYTALYHAQLSPNVFQDADGRYLGMDLQVHQGDTADPYYTIFSLWDTHRALHPLISIIHPEQNEAYLRSLIRKGEEGGLVPKWDCGSNYTGCMIGYHYVALLADMMTKGYRHFDVDLAYKHAVRSAEYDTTGITPACPSWLYPYIMPKARLYRQTLGYVPADKENESVAKALELCYDDWCLSRVARLMGDTARAAKYDRWARLYANYYDASVGYMRGKLADGSWRTPFSPVRSNHRQDDYCEGNACQWSWFVPHDAEGLMKLCGGREAFVRKLDALFAASSELEGESVSADISGLIGQYAHGNEPSHHVIHFYNAAGQPWRTQELADSVLQTLYTDKPDGLSGNEDCGQMSAWYILNAMGFYQPCPGRPVYSIGRPLFPAVTIHLPSGRDFIIRAPGNSRRAKYVRSMILNGKPLPQPYFTHEQLMEGGELVLEMAETREQTAAKQAGRR